MNEDIVIMGNDILYGIGMLLAASGVQHDARVFMSEPRTIRVRLPDPENINVGDSEFQRQSAQATVPHGNLTRL